MLWSVGKPVMLGKQHLSNCFINLGIFKHNSSRAFACFFTWWVFDSRCLTCAFQAVSRKSYLYESRSQSRLWLHKLWFLWLGLPCLIQTDDSRLLGESFPTGAFVLFVYVEETNFVWLFFFCGTQKMFCRIIFYIW